MSAIESGLIKAWSVFIKVAMPVVFGAVLGTLGLWLSLGWCGWLGYQKGLRRCRRKSLRGYSGVGYLTVAWGTVGFLFALVGAVVGAPAVLWWTFVAGAAGMRRAEAVRMQACPMACG